MKKKKGKCRILFSLLHHPVLQGRIILFFLLFRLFGDPGACERSVVAVVAVDENFVRHNNFNHVVAVVLAAQNFVLDFVLDFGNPKDFVLELESRVSLGPIFNSVDLDLDRVITRNTESNSPNAKISLGLTNTLFNRSDEHVHERVPLAIAHVDVVPAVDTSHRVPLGKTVVVIGSKCHFSLVCFSLLSWFA